MAGDPSKPYAELGPQTSTGVLLVRDELVCGTKLTATSITLGTGADAVVLEVRRSDTGVLTLDVRAEAPADRVDVVGDRIGVRQIPTNLASPVTTMAYADAISPGFYSAAGTIAPPPGVAASIYGSMRDGNATDPPSPATGDRFYDVLTLTNGYSLDMNGNALHARVIVAPAVGSARIHDDGNHAVGQGPGAGKAAGTLRQSGAAGGGGGNATSGGAGGTSTGQSVAPVGNGGNGGAGSTGVPGTGATATLVASSDEYAPRPERGGPVGMYASRYGSTIGYVPRGGGGGGGGAGGTSSGVGGGGGGGGGIVMVRAGAIVNAGNLVVSARGGNGDTRTPLGASPGTGGGGGGGGGNVYVTVGSKTPPVVDVSGGSGAPGLGTGTAGVNGTSGSAVIVTG
jgi:hypothetical protein